MDQELRKVALSLSVDLHKVWLEKGEITATAELQLEDIRYIAQIFYDFLKGETK
jgi:hypothetical protein